MNKNKKTVRDKSYYMAMINSNRKKEKDIPTLIHFRNVMGEKHYIVAKKRKKGIGPDGKPGYITEYYERKFDMIKDWEKETNFVRMIDLWEPSIKKGKAEAAGTEDQNETIENKKIKMGYKWLRFIAVEGPNGKKFPIPPTYEMVMNKHTTQYLWRLKEAVPESMMDSVYLLAASIAYLVPGCKSMHTTYDAKIRMPGIPDLLSGWIGTFDQVGGSYSYSELEKKVYEHFPVVGKSLHKYLKSEAIYVPDLKTTHQFIAIRRLNKLLNAGKKLAKHVFYECSGSFLYFAWTFARDVGMEDSNIIRLLQDFCARHFRKITDEDIMASMPVRNLRFKDVTIVRTLGDWAAKVFTYVKKMRTPRIEIHERVEAARKAVAQLAGEGHTIREIAATLGLTISTVKRHRSLAVKAGLIASPI